MKIDTFKRFYRELKRWEGTPYSHLQMNIGTGADCGLFILNALYNCGIVLSCSFIDYHPRFWTKIFDRELLLEHIDTVKNKYMAEGYWMDEVNEPLLPGDILTFALRNRRTNHIAVFIGNSKIIHSIENRGVVEQKFESIYKVRLTKVFRICQ